MDSNYKYKKNKDIKFISDYGKTIVCVPPELIKNKTEDELLQLQDEIIKRYRQEYPYG